MRRWVIHSETTFEASHALTMYQGEPEESHLHTWKSAITVGTDELNTEGYALDFHAVHSILAEAVEPLRNADLNQHPAIGHPTPSAERVAQFLADTLAPRLETLGGTLLTVSVWEGPENRVDYHVTA